MPKSAEEALEGKLAEGVDATAVLEALEAKGFKIEPPTDDASYGDEAGGLMVALGVGAPESDGEKEDKEGSEKSPAMPAGPEPEESMSRSDRLKKAAQTAMKKDNEKYEGRSRF